MHQMIKHNRCRSLKKYKEKFANENIVVGGHLNCALKELDKKGENPVSRKVAVIKENNLRNYATYTI